MTEPGAPRRVLLLAHTGRDAARDVTLAFCKALTGHGLLVRMLEEEAADLELDPASYDPPSSWSTPTRMPAPTARSPSSSGATARSSGPRR